MVVVTHRPQPEGSDIEAPFHFAGGVEEAVAKAQEFAGDRVVEVAAGELGRGSDQRALPGRDRLITGVAGGYRGDLPGLAIAPRIDAAVGISPHGRIRHRLGGSGHVRCVLRSGGDVSDEVDIDAAAVETAVAGIRSISVEWVGYSHDFTISGVGSGVSDKTAAAATTWWQEFQAAASGMSAVAIKVEADLAGFAKLDSTLVTSPSGPGPRPR